MPSGSSSTRSTICWGVWRSTPGAVVRAVRHADAGVEQAEVVVDLGDRADRRPRVARRGLLVDRDGRRQALDEVDVGLVHLAEELAGVRRQRLDVAALPLGVDRVEGERGLARARQPGEDDQLVARQLDEMFFRLCSRAPRTTSVSAIRAIVSPARPFRTDVRSGCDVPADHDVVPEELGRSAPLSNWNPGYVGVGRPRDRAGGRWESRTSISLGAGLRCATADRPRQRPPVGLRALTVVAARRSSQRRSPYQLPISLPIQGWSLTITTSPGHVEHVLQRTG